jgi:hypothetical protein
MLLYLNGNEVSRYHSCSLTEKEKLGTMGFLTSKCEGGKIICKKAQNLTQVNHKEKL